MSARQVDDREDKLPKWAQQELTYLRRELDARDEVLARQLPTVDNFLELTGYEPFTLHGKSTGHKYVPWDEDVTASWLIGDNPHRPERLDIRLEVDSRTGRRNLRIASQGAKIVVSPHVTNVIEVGVIER